MRRASIAAVAFTTLLAFTRPAFAADAAGAAEPAGLAAAPLPSKDIRSSLELGGAVDVGSLPRASPGIVLGFDVRRGALGFHAAASAFLPQSERRSGASSASSAGASVGLFDVLASICALAPLGSRFDLGACGGLGAGLLRADSGAAPALRPEGLAITRFDIVLVPGLLLTLDAGTAIDPLRTAVGDASRSALFSFRGSLGILVRLW
jgi:hypothetical protein